LQPNWPNEDNFNVSFNLLKNKINTIFDMKNNLTISENHPISIPREAQRIPEPKLVHNQNLHQLEDFETTRQVIQGGQPNQSGKKMSTPISKLQKDIIETKANTASTPLNNIRENFYNIPEPIITEEGYQESNTGSDLGSVMDLDDFEKSL
jgi:hypothetical protein